MNWLPSRKMPPIPYDRLDWKLKAAFGKRELTAVWRALWEEGVDAGRAEGIVGTLLVVLVLAVLVLLIRKR